MNPFRAAIIALLAKDLASIGKRGSFPKSQNLNPRASMDSATDSKFSQIITRQSYSPWTPTPTTCSSLMSCSAPSALRIA